MPVSLLSLSQNINLESGKCLESIHGINSKTSPSLEDPFFLSSAVAVIVITLVSANSLLAHQLLPLNFP